MPGRPERSEAAPYYFGYIDQVSGDDVVRLLDEQVRGFVARLASIPEQRSLYRYAPEKWSLREVLGHINDCERLFMLRAFWFARGFDTPLPSFDQNVAVPFAKSHEIEWARHIEEFHAIRTASIAFFQNLPEAAWTRGGIASDNRFTVRALAYITVGHVTHHWKIIEDKYLRD